MLRVRGGEGRGKSLGEDKGQKMERGKEREGRERVKERKGRRERRLE